MSRVQKVRPENRGIQDSQEETAIRARLEILEDKGPWVQVANLDKMDPLA